MRRPSSRRSGDWFGAPSDTTPFDNPINTLTFDNPFRVTDSTDPAAYTGPASGSINGPARGRIDLPTTRH